MSPAIQGKGALWWKGCPRAGSLLKGHHTSVEPAPCCRALWRSLAAARAHGAGWLGMISSRQAGSFKEPFSQVGALNGSDAPWPPFPCGPFIYQEMKLVTGFLTLPNLTDEIWFLPGFKRSINSLLLSSTWGLGRGNPRHYQGLRTPTRKGGRGWSEEQTTE